MRRLRRNLELALQRGDPTLHEVHVVEEHPTSILGVLVQNSLRHGLLTLTHGNHGELTVLRRLAKAVGQRLNLFGGRVSREENEEDGRRRACLLVHLGGVERFLVDVVGTHNPLHELREGAGNAIRSHSAHEHQLLEI